MIRTASFKRAFFEVGLPAWLIFTALFIIQRGERGLSGFSIFFMPLWSALRLNQPDIPKMEQIIYYSGFCLAHCAAVLVVVYTVGFVLSLTGTIPWPSSWTPLISSVTSLMVMILIPFFVVRGAMALPGAIHQTEKPVKSVPSVPP